jgi:anti-sigma B factor antagonist
MPLDEPPPPSTSVRRNSCVASDPLSTVVWVRGEHDSTTSAALSITLGQAERLDRAEVIVDLSGVTFMDASTIDALVGAGNRLGVLSRHLSVRAPSPRARRLLELCGLPHLIDEHATLARPPAPTAVGSWVDVPARDRGANSAPPPVARTALSGEPACVLARRRVGPVESVGPRRAMS